MPPERLRWFCDPAELPFETTERLRPQDGAIGQERGIAALEFGLEMESPGFNLFVAGPPGTGRMTAASLGPSFATPTNGFTTLPPCTS